MRIHPSLAAKGPVCKSRSQLFQTGGFLNLILNAQQAMPDGGDMIIPARTLPMIRHFWTFSDPDVGIPKEIWSADF